MNQTTTAIDVRYLSARAIKREFVSVGIQSISAESVEALNHFLSEIYQSLISAMKSIDEENWPLFKMECVENGLKSVLRNEAMRQGAIDESKILLEQELARISNENQSMEAMIQLDMDNVGNDTINRDSEHVRRFLIPYPRIQDKMKETVERGITPVQIKFDSFAIVFLTGILEYIGGLMLAAIVDLTKRTKRSTVKMEDIFAAMNDAPDFKELLKDFETMKRIERKLSKKNLGVESHQQPLQSTSDQKLIENEQNSDEKHQSIPRPSNRSSMIGATAAQRDDISSKDLYRNGRLRGKEATQSVDSLDTYSESQRFAETLIEVLNANPEEMILKPVLDTVQQQEQHPVLELVPEEVGNSKPSSVASMQLVAASPDGSQSSKVSPANSTKKMNSKPISRGSSVNDEEDDDDEPNAKPKKGKRGNASESLADFLRSDPEEFNIKLKKPAKQSESLFSLIKRPLMKSSGKSNGPSQDSKTVANGGVVMISSYMKNNELVQLNPQSKTSADEREPGAKSAMAQITAIQRPAFQAKVEKSLKKSKSSESDILDEDEELFGDRKPKKKGETLAEFLKTEPPADMLAANKQTLASNGPAPKKNIKDSQTKSKVIMIGNPSGVVRSSSQLHSSMSSIPEQDVLSFDQEEQTTTNPITHARDARISFQTLFQSSRVSLFQQGAIPEQNSPSNSDIATVDTQAKTDSADKDSLKIFFELKRENLLLKNHVQRLQAFAKKLLVKNVEQKRVTTPIETATTDENQMDIMRKQIDEQKALIEKLQTQNREQEITIEILNAKQQNSVSLQQKLQEKLDTLAQRAFIKINELLSEKQALELLLSSLEKDFNIEELLLSQTTPAIPDNAGQTNPPSSESIDMEKATAILSEYSSLSIILQPSRIVKRANLRSSSQDEFDPDAYHSQALY